ncbi:MAG: NAD(P)-binding domain-containing protein [Bacteroidales bacterium]|nr:NAD(P)-binding domain-containing protein [Bacteroidales bacterium]
MTDNMIAMIGSGSWATALVKILLENRSHHLRWWMRDGEVRDSLATTGRNPRHLTDLQLDASRFHVSTDLSSVVATSDTLVLAVPSVFLANTLATLPATALHGKHIVSAVKGYLPGYRKSVSEYLQEQLQVPADNICVVSGPSHAEEVAEGKATFLTVASSNRQLATNAAAMLGCGYIHASVSDEVHTIELCGLTKNVYAVAAGIADGLGYGDNLVAVLTTAAAHEIQGIIPETALTFRLLSDLIVTCFSRHSRNRALGVAVAHGVSPGQYFRDTGMVAEGYYSADAMHFMSHPCPTPIADAVYDILYRGADPATCFSYLIDNVL